MVKIRVEKSGTFEFEKKTRVIKTPVAIVRAFEKAQKDSSLLSLINVYEKEARQILRRNGIKPDLKSGIPENAHDVVKLAHNLLFYCNNTRKYLEAGNVEACAVAALCVGRTGTIIRARAFEPAAKTGLRVKRVTAQNRQSKELKKAIERKRGEYIQWANCAADYRMRHPNHSETVVADYVKKHLDANQAASTIRKKLRELKKAGQV